MLHAALEQSCLTEIDPTLARSEWVHFLPCLELPQ